MSYCVHCGAEGAAAFCARCGKSQSDSAQRTDSTHSSESANSIVDASIHWAESIQYDAVLAHPEARQRIAAASEGASKGLTGDDLLAVFDAVNPTGISFEKLVHAVVPIYDKLGIKTGHQSRCIFDSPPGRVILAMLCTLAKRSQTIDEVRQESDRCVLSSEIPSGIFTNRGKLHMLVEDHPQYVQLSLGVSIAGQWYDWGKSKRLIDEMFAAVYADITDQQSGQGPRYRRVA